MLEGKTLCEQARFACQQNCVIMNSSNRRIVSPAEVSFKKPWKKKKKKKSGAFYSENNAWHVNTGNRSVMKESYVLFNVFDWAQVMCRDFKILVDKKTEDLGVWSSVYTVTCESARVNLIISSIPLSVAHCVHLLGLLSQDSLKSHHVL